MRLMEGLFIVLFCSFFLSGCASVPDIPLEIPLEPKTSISKPPDHPIEILDSKDIYRPYKTIGRVEEEQGGFSSKEEVIEKLKSKARNMGGDALINLKQRPVSFYARGSAFSQFWSAEVIVWESPTPAQTTQDSETKPGRKREQRIIKFE